MLARKILALALLCALIPTLRGGFSVAGSTVEAAANIVVNVAINYGNGTAQWFNSTQVPQGYTLFNATKQIARLEATYYASFNDYFITGINGVRNDAVRGIYWIIWVYDLTSRTYKIPDVGANHIVLKSGDTIQWYYEDTNQYPPPSPLTVISLSLSAPVVRANSSLTISGVVRQNPAAYNVTIQYSLDKGRTWTTIATVQTSADGRFSATWKPTKNGDYVVRAVVGNLTSNQVMLTVSPCMIVAATYGSEAAAEVQYLREFRDGYVMSTFAGSQFIAIFNLWYYSFSPSVAAAIASSEELRASARFLLYPLLAILHFSTVFRSLEAYNREASVILSGIAASALIGIVYGTPLLLSFERLVRREIARKLSGRAFSLSMLLSLFGLVLAILAENATLASAFSAIVVVSTLLFSAASLALKIRHLVSRYAKPNWLAA